MGSKSIVLLGLFLAMVLFISSQVAASRELAETSNTGLDTSTETKETDGAVNDAKYPGGGGNYGGGYPGGGGNYGGGYPGRGGGNYGGGYPGRGGGNYGGGYPGRGGGGNYGGGYPGRGGGGGRGGYCRYGCCGRSYYRGGCRCCTFAGQKADADLQAKPHN